MALNEKENNGDPASIGNLVEHVSASGEDSSSTDDSTDNIKKLIPHMMTFTVHSIFKLLVWAFLLLPRLGRYFVLHNRHRQSPNGQSPSLEDSSSREQKVSEDIKEESLHPCWQRLEHLETMIDELANKPNIIPPEKEDMLLESLSRIKCIEHDLQKTKKALLATASKQVELAETLEALKEHALNGVSSCWPRNCRTFPPER